MVHCGSCNKFWSYNKKIQPGRRCLSCQTIMDFKCGRCGRIYKLLSSLKKHLRYVCMREPSFTCSMCDYKSCRRYTMANHLLRKHQVSTESYKCQNCHEIFTNNLKMEKHMRLCTFALNQMQDESSEKPLFCNDCDFRTLYKVNLTAHIHYNHSKREIYPAVNAPSKNSGLKMVLPLNLSKSSGKTQEKPITIPSPVEITEKTAGLPGM